MADFSVLMASNDASPLTGQYQGSFILYGRYRIPVFWLALFRNNNVVDIEFEKGTLPSPYLVERRSICLANLLDRKDSLIQAIPKSQIAVFEEFYSILQKLPEKFLHCDPTHVISTINNGRPIKRWMGECLNAFEGPPPIRRRNRGFVSRAGFESRLGKHPWQISERF
jgi:hypothetical protein